MSCRRALLRSGVAVGRPRAKARPQPVERVLRVPLASNQHSDRHGSRIRTERPIGPSGFPTSRSSMPSAYCPLGSGDRDSAPAPNSQRHDRPISASGNRVAEHPRSPALRRYRTSTEAFRSARRPGKPAKNGSSALAGSEPLGGTRRWTRTPPGPSTCRREACINSATRLRSRSES
jgi:hypothetical protein